MALMRWFHPLLLWLPPEVAHAVAKRGMQLFQWLTLWVRKSRYTAPRRIEIASTPGLGFGSRVGVAAGLDKDAEVFAALGLLGAGFVEVGTVTPLPQEGNPKPRLWRVRPDTLINHMGFNSCGLDAFKQNLDRYRPLLQGVPILANIGKNRQTPAEKAIRDYHLGFEVLSSSVDGFVVNLSSPNTPGLVDLQTESFLKELAAVAPVNLPVWIKLSADLPNAAIAALGKVVRAEPRLTGLVVTNTSREMACEVFGWEQGGVSGKVLFSRALECVHLAREALGPGKSVIGVGGVFHKAAAKEMLRAGADLVEVYTGLVYRGPSLLNELRALD